jgi:hypothetical protein
MHPEMIARQIIDFQKATFNNSLDAIILMQDNSEKIIGEFVEKATFFPPESKKAITVWLGSYNKGRKDFKIAADDGFKAIEDFFVGAANAMGFSIYGMVEKTDQSIRDVTDKLKKASVEIVDRSIQRIATVADKNIDQNVMMKKEVTVGKSGTGAAKTVRRTVKTVK